MHALTWFILFLMALSSPFSYHWSLIIFNLKLLNYKLQIINHRCNCNFNLRLCAFSAFLVLVQSDTTLRLQIERQVKPFPKLSIYRFPNFFTHSAKRSEAQIFISRHSLLFRFRVQAKLTFLLVFSFFTSRFYSEKK